MATDITFVDRQTVIPTDWNQNVNDSVNLTDASTLGAKFLNRDTATLGAGIPRWKRTTNYAVNSLGWLAKQDVVSALSFEDIWTAVEAGTDCTTAVQAALDFLLLIGRRKLFFPAHPNGYVFDGGVASLDGYKNGLLCRFTQVNFDANETLVLQGEGGTVFKCGSNNMILLRISRNNVTVRDISLSHNGKTNVILCGIVPEDMTQTSTLVSQSMVFLDGVNREGGVGVEGLVVQPGPNVGGADSGCFYHVISGGVSNFVGGGRHVWLKKNADWSTVPNRPTRTIFRDQRLLRGNTGYYFEVGSEIELHGCNEELINSGITPLATPTARYVSADCTNISFVGGYSEQCSLAVNPVANGILRSIFYIPASGSDLNWIANVESWADETAGNRSFTPILASSLGGAEGAGTKLGVASKQGKDVLFTIQVSVAWGTLNSGGSLSISGLPFIADPAWGSQNVEVTSWSGITLGANYVKLYALISGASLSIRKQHGQGAGTAGLLISECSDPIVLTIQGTYRAQ
jgi:hypothetical protein